MNKAKQWVNIGICPLHNRCFFSCEGQYHVPVMMLYQIVFWYYLIDDMSKISSSYYNKKKKLWFNDHDQSNIMIGIYSSDKTDYSPVELYVFSIMNQIMIISLKTLDKSKEVNLFTLNNTGNKIPVATGKNCSFPAFFRCTTGNPT